MKVRCPYCGEDVTKGIKAWRRRVTIAHDFQRAVECRILGTIRMIEQGPNCRNTTAAADQDEIDGLRCALDATRTEMNIIIYSHHSHIDFVIQQRSAGFLPSDLSI